MTSIQKKKQKKEATIEFIKECISDYEKLANEHEKLAKQYREISQFWKNRYDRTSVLEPLFVDDVKIETIKKITFRKT